MNSLEIIQVEFVLYIHLQTMIKLWISEKNMNILGLLHERVPSTPQERQAHKNTV